MYPTEPNAVWACKNSVSVPNPCDQKSFIYRQKSHLKKTHIED